MKTQYKRLAGAALLLALLAPTTHAAVTETRTTAYVYDSKGQVVRELIEPQDSNFCLVTEYTYDGHGNRTSTQPRNCNGTSTIPGVGTEAAKPTGTALFTTGAVQVRYDYPGVNSATERKVTTTNALGHQGVEVQDTGFGTPLSRTDANGLVTRWRYDGFGRKTLEQEPDGSGTRWVYEKCNVDSATTCPQASIYTLVYRLSHYEVSGANVATDAGTKNGPYSRTYHDNLDHVVVAESEGWDGAGAARPIRQFHYYDLRGRPAGKSRPYYADQGVPTGVVAGFDYDVLGRVTYESRFDGGSTQTTYDGLTIRREVAVVNTASANTTQTTHTITETRNALGQVVSITDTLGKALTRSYTPFGDLETSTDSAGNTVTVKYNLRGHKIKQIDPDLGTWIYESNALGQLVKQTDALNKSSTLEYDLLGRLKRRVEPDHESRWAYDTQYADASACANAKGRLCEASTTNGYSRKLSYDSLGRPATTTTKADVTGGTGSYQDDLTYNARSQVATRTYPGPSGQRLSLTHTYTALGYLKSVKNTSTGTVYWSAGQQDEYGNLTQQTYGNGVSTTRSYDFMQRLLTSAAGSGNAVQNDSYSYDYAGNLRSRTETRAGAILTTQYDYDNLNRLKTEARSGGAVTGTQTLTWSYDDIGNLTSRSDVGTYTYPASGANAVRPHAVSSITGTVNGVTNPGYSYDANGNILTSAGRSATWTSFNLPATLTRGTNQLSWLYDSEHERVREQLKVNGTLTRTTVYVNPAAGAGLFYEEEIAGNVVKRRHYINGGEGAMAVLTRQSGVADEVRYWHKDHLDSNTVVTNESGAVVERLEYEPFGKRRKADNATDAAGTLTAISTDRGFTEHEMLDEVGLIHMNGRIFDPAIGRFLSGDPGVPHPDDLQSYNRYSYARNRPLSMVDPSGFDDWGREPQGESGGAGSGSTGSSISSPQPGAGASAGQTDVPKVGNVVGYDAVLSWNNAGNGQATYTTNGAEVYDGVVFKHPGRIEGPGEMGRPTYQEPNIRLHGRCDEVCQTEIYVKSPNFHRRNILAMIQAGAVMHGMAMQGGRAGAPGGCPCCFVAGTLVLTESGLVPIELVQVGTLVYSRDEVTEQLALKPVTDLIYNEGREIYGLNFLEATGRATRIEASDNHPFWVVGLGWVDSAQLRQGMRVSTYDQGTIAVVNVEYLGRTQPTYNFTVADFHTFFAGESRALVHNMCACGAKVLTSAQKTQIATLRGGGEVHVSSVNEARALLSNMPELRPATQERVLPNPGGGLGNGFGDARGTFRGDLINKSDPTAPIHPGVQNPLHANHPHYNIRLPDGNKAAIIIITR